jgi:5-methylthioadenosine/S-adenosylhomocysteine deaminase
LLHLSEGLDVEARDAFLALKHGNQWAISKALAGIHCAALQPQDFAVLKAKDGSVVWSPLSNLLLYGGTTAHT